MPTQLPDPRTLPSCSVLQRMCCADPRGRGRGGRGSGATPTSAATSRSPATNCGPLSRIDGRTRSTSRHRSATETRSARPRARGAGGFARPPAHLAPARPGHRRTAGRTARRPRRAHRTRRRRGRPAGPSTLSAVMTGPSLRAVRWAAAQAHRRRVPLRDRARGPGPESACSEWLPRRHPLELRVTRAGQRQRESRPRRSRCWQYRSSSLRCTHRFSHRWSWRSHWRTRWSQ